MLLSCCLIATISFTSTYIYVIFSFAKHFIIRMATMSKHPRPTFSTRSGAGGKLVPCAWGGLPALCAAPAAHGYLPVCPGTPRLPTVPQPHRGSCEYSSVLSERSSTLKYWHAYLFILFQWPFFTGYHCCNLVAQRRTCLRVLKPSQMSLIL